MNALANDTSLDETAMADYVKSANTQFGGAIAALNDLKTTAKTAKFTGEKGQAFKDEVVEDIFKFATELTGDLQTIVTSVNNATKAIGSSLGATIPTVAFNPEAQIANDKDAENSAMKSIDYDSMLELAQKLVSQIEAVGVIIQNHNTLFQGTAWTGRAKRQAVGRVDELSRLSIDKCNTLGTNIGGRITDQVNATQEADVLVG